MTHTYLWTDEDTGFTIFKDSNGTQYFLTEDLDDFPMIYNNPTPPPLQGPIIDGGYRIYDTPEDEIRILNEMTEIGWMDFPL